jgi:ParB family chromosome partitioning protein
MSAPRKLGRGLDALLGSRPRSVAHAVASDSSDSAAFPTLELAVAVLRPGRYQPRLSLSEDSLAELADSIREQGVLQPLVVRPQADAVAAAEGSTHEIVAGERRWRAARLAGLETVPVVVRELDDQSALAVALIENLQREDLNPIEQARSLSRLAEEFGLTHQQVADAVGRSRSSVSNLLRLLDLHADVKQLLASGGIEMGHARALLPLTAEQQVTIARKAERSGMSVRQVEQLVRDRLKSQGDERTTAVPAIDLQTRWLQQQIADELGRRVAIRCRGDGSYKLDVDFGDLGQLQEALGKIQQLVAQISDTAGPRVRDAGKT